VATFYWDPVNAQGISYRLTLMDEGRNVLTSVDAGNVTNVSLDVSQGAIGGQFQIIVQLVALLNGRVVCSDERFILREAGSAPPPPLTGTTPQPTIPGVPTPVPTNPPPPPTPRPTNPPTCGPNCVG
jgi:hypothetical protein